VVELEQAIQIRDGDSVERLTAQVGKVSPTLAGEVQGSGLLSASQGQILGRAISQTVQAAQQMKRSIERDSGLSM
jgi:hypothetical protein